MKYLKTEKYYFFEHDGEVYRRIEGEFSETSWKMIFLDINHLIEIKTCVAKKLEEEYQHLMHCDKCDHFKEYEKMTNACPCPKCENTMWRVGS